MSRFARAAAIFAIASLGGVFACGSDDSGGKSGAGGTSAGGGGSGGKASGGGGTKPSGGGGGGGTPTGGTGGTAQTGGTAGMPSGGSAGAINYGPYPSGPYGHDVGSVIADLKWEGFVNETGAASSDTMPYIDYGTDQMRKSGKPFGLIHVSAFT